MRCNRTKTTTPLRSPSDHTNSDAGRIVPKPFQSTRSGTTLLLIIQQKCCIFLLLTSNQLKRWLAKQGCTFEAGHGGHVIVRLGEKMTVLPMHGSAKELGTGLVQKIKRDLGLR